MKKMKNKQTGEISYIDEEELKNDCKLVNKYKVTKETELKENLIEVQE